MERHRLNAIYEKLDKRAGEISKLLHSSYGYYNGHYFRNASGDYEMDYFPIPVIEIKEICDIEIGIDGISVTAKLSRESALSFDFDKIRSYRFEAYGAENYLEDFYLAGDTVDTMIEKITKSEEKSIFFSFSFPFETDPVVLCRFAEWISSEGFFY